LLATLNCRQAHEIETYARLEEIEGVGQLKPAAAGADVEKKLDIVLAGFE